MELKNNISELEKESKSMTGFWVNTWNMITFRMGKSARKINANSDKIADAMDKIADARRRLVAIEEGDEEALTGVLRLMPALAGCEFMLMGVD